jgi:HNH endonuclease
MKKCRDCGSNHICKTKLCANCSKRARESVAKRNSELKSNGLCISCGINSNLPNILRCQGCKEKLDNASTNRVKKYLAGGKCTKCGKNKNGIKIWSNVWCAYCHLKYKFKYSTTHNNADQIINDLLTKQNYKCALTGRDLHTNKFHIDHIIPKSKGGKYDPSNWQLIVEEANVFKTDLSMDEIIRLARDIASNFDETQSKSHQTTTQEA